jgi:membrane-bound lytic murein transglycosylase B
VNIRPCLILAAAALLPLAAPAALLDQPLPPEQFSACVQGLAEQVGSAGKPLTREDFQRIAAAGKYDDRVRQSMLVQAGEPTYWWDELAGTTDDQRVQDGLKVLEREGDALRKIEARFGVPKEIIVAIYGIETNFGPAGGRIPVLDSALSMACLRPCPASTGTPGAPATCRSRERAFAAVRLLRDNKVRPENFQGSWASAFGRTQFVPDTLEMVGVDFDGDGVVDVIGSERDAWASTANHLKTRGGWIAGAPVWIEVTVPAGEQAAYAGKGESIRQQDKIRKLSEWAAQGWKAVGPNGESLPLVGDFEAYPFLPVGLPGPAFLVTRNFNTILRYNSSERYGMEVSLLAHKLAGGRDFVTPWPTDDPGLSRAQVKELQQWLVQKGYTKVIPDGVQGRNTREAIAAEFTAKGLPPQRRAGQRTMKLLMQP